MATISSNIALTKTQDYFNKIASITQSSKDRDSVYKFVQGLYDLKLWNNIVCWILGKSHNTGVGVVVYSLGGLGNYTGLIINTSLTPFVLEQDPSIALLLENGEILFVETASLTDVWSEQGFISTSNKSEYISILNESQLLSRQNVSSGSVFKSNNTMWNDTYYWLYGNAEIWSTNIQNGGSFIESNGVGLVNQMRNQTLIDSLNTSNASNNNFQFFANVTSNTNTLDYRNNLLQKSRTVPAIDAYGPTEGIYSYQIGKIIGTDANVTGCTAFHWVVNNIAMTQQQINDLFHLYKTTIGKNTI
jgi:hypothetical protein